MKLRVILLILGWSIELRWRRCSDPQRMFLLVSARRIASDNLMIRQRKTNTLYDQHHHRHDTWKEDVEIGTTSETARGIKNSASFFNSTIFSSVEKSIRIPAINQEDCESTWNCTQKTNVTSKNTTITVITQTLSPTPDDPSTMNDMNNGDPYSPKQNRMSPFDVLVAALFLIASGWLILAIIYAIILLCILRLRSRGDLDVFDENFGRFYICCCFGPTSRYHWNCYIPLGCLLRRHVIALSSPNPDSVRVMSREERRAAMEYFLFRGLGQVQKQKEDDHYETSSNILLDDENNNAEHLTQDNNIEHADDLILNGEHDCSICLCEFDPLEENLIWTSPTCTHKFHSNCILDWLERRNHTQCPCCRETVISEDEIWKWVQRNRREQRSVRFFQTTKAAFSCWHSALFSCCCGTLPEQSPPPTNTTTRTTNNTTTNTMGAQNAPDLIAADLNVPSNSLAIIEEGLILRRSEIYAENNLRIEQVPLEESEEILSGATYEELQADFSAVSHIRDVIVTDDNHTVTYPSSLYDP